MGMGMGKKKGGMRGGSWCCSFSVAPPQSSTSQKPPDYFQTNPKSLHSFPNSPRPLNLVNRILSPGRVSPLNHPSLPQNPDSLPPNINNFNILQNQSFSTKNGPKPLICERNEKVELGNEEIKEELGVFDVRMSLKGKRGGQLVLEMNSGVLSENSMIFSDLIVEYRKGLEGSNSNSNLVRIEVPEVDNLFVFRETVELMFLEGEDSILRKLVKFGVFRSIDILEVSANIKFKRAVGSCLKYLEAVPWSEEEEEKLRSLFDKFTFDEAKTGDILARLGSLDSENSQQSLTKQLICSITSSTDPTARNELKSLVKGLLQKSSVYETTHPDIDKDDLYTVCQCCLESLVVLFKEASGNNCSETIVKRDSHKPLVERISRQVDNINWVLEILLDRESAEDFVDLWTKQNVLLKMHDSTSPMVRYELSRVSASLFIAIGTRKIHCRLEARLGLLKAWFSPMLSDFGWLQRCKRGLDMKSLEESMGQTLLTLPLKHQYDLFMEWFQCFSKQGNDCPNLSKAFQIWWRRSFLRGSESHAVESR